MLGALLLMQVGSLLLWALPACGIHELGHIAAVRALRGRVKQFRLTGGGAVIVPERKEMFSYWEECLIALAGPAASILLALLAGVWAKRFGGTGAYMLTGLSLAFGVFNLLPAGPLDGGRMLRAAASRLAGPDRGEKLWVLLTVALAGLLSGAGFWIMTKNGNFTLLLCGLWLWIWIFSLKKI